jgi:molybdate transport system ATP-binding protein
MSEIERLADHVVLMQSGRVLASGALAELQSDPTLPLAGRLDAAVTFDVVTTAYDAAYRLATVQVHGGHLTVPHADTSNSDAGFTSGPEINPQILSPR